MGISAIKAGHGVFLCPQFMVQEELDEGTLVQAYPKALDTSIDFYAYYAKNSPKRARIDTFVRWLKQEVNHKTEKSTMETTHQPLPWP
jgi:LysR family glycine cleavage system transcriptional activator